MAEFFTNYPQAQKPMSLGDMLNIASGVQNYQQAQQMNPLALQKAKMEIEQAQQVNPLKVRQEQAATQGAEFDLDQKQNEGLYRLAGSVLHDRRLESNDPKQVEAAINSAKQGAESLRIPKEYVDKAFQPLLEQAKESPTLVKHSIANLVQRGLTAAQQQQLLAGQEAVQGTDIYGNPLVVRTNPLTGEKVQKPLPTVAGTVGTPTGVKAADMGMRFAPGESAGTVEAMQVERAQAKQSASAAASALTNIETIKKYLPLAQTGKYSEAVAGLQSAFGNLAGSTAEEKAASARDIIQKNIADLGLQKNTALGGKFAADLSAVQQSIADAGKNPTAILKSMEQLEPLIQHAQLYQQGLEKAIEKNGGNIQVKRKYDNEMVTAFDPQALMAYNAYKAGDKKALSSLSQQQKEQLFAKIQRYARLVNGDL